VCHNTGSIQITGALASALILRAATAIPALFGIRLVAA
jgi:type IV secretory pathway TrbD component